MIKKIVSISIIGLLFFINLNSVTGFRNDFNSNDKPIEINDNLPDLTVRFGRVITSFVQPFIYYETLMIIKNEGTLPITIDEGNLVIRITAEFLGKEVYNKDRYLWDESNGFVSIKPGERVDFYVSWGPVPPGSKLKIQIDPWNIFEEINEDNNECGGRWPNLFNALLNAIEILKDLFQSRY